MKVGILGGTGPTGRGLAVRLAAGGVPVVIGSRDAARAQEVASNLIATWSDRLTAPPIGGANEDAAAGDLVIVATPWDAAVATITPQAAALAGKVVVSMVNTLARQGREMLALIPPRGSMAAAVQAALPRSSVSAAFHHLPASEMENLDSGLDADVLICSDHQTATTATRGLVDAMDGLRGLDAGSLAQAAAIEAFTAVCITINMRHKVHSTVKLTGI